MLDYLELVLDHKFTPLAAFALLIASFIFFYQRNTRYIRIEAKLPTSMIGSLTVGLVEVRGRISPLRSCASPSFATKCIGYHYKIEKVWTDSDGDTRHSEKYQENKILPFMISDETGSVTVDPENLVARSLKKERRRKGDYRHTQSVLREGDEVVMFGRARSENGKLVLGHDPHHDLFLIIPKDQMDNDTKEAPFVRSACMMLFAMLTATALVMYL